MKKPEINLSGNVFFMNQRIGILEFGEPSYLLFELSVS
jgi:hypothetical protein